MVDVEGLPRHTPAGHSLAFKLRFACFHLLIVKPRGFRPEIYTEYKIKTTAWVVFILSWWMLRDSNPRPSRCKRDALIN